MQSAAGVRRYLLVFIASGAFSGYAPVASGTVGTMVAVPLAVPASWLSDWSAGAYALVLAAVVMLACWVAGQAERIFGEHDSRRIVIDEIVGYLVAVALLPASGVTLAAGFVLFRAFDVAKPFPASWFDRNLPGGAGVVLDDVVAGLYTNAVLHVFLAAGWLV